MDGLTCCCGWPSRFVSRDDDHVRETDDYIFDAASHRVSEGEVLKWMEVCSVQDGLWLRCAYRGLWRRLCGMSGQIEAASIHESVMQFDGGWLQPNSNRSYTAA